MVAFSGSFGLASDARDVNQLCDSPQSVLKACKNAQNGLKLSIQHKQHGIKKTHIRDRCSQFGYR